MLRRLVRLAIVLGVVLWAAPRAVQAQPPWRVEWELEAMGEGVERALGSRVLAAMGLNDSTEIFCAAGALLGLEQGEVAQHTTLDCGVAWRFDMVRVVPEIIFESGVGVQPSNIWRWRWRAAVGARYYVAADWFLGARVGLRGIGRNTGASASVGLGWHVIW